MTMGSRLLSRGVFVLVVWVFSHGVQARTFPSNQIPTHLNQERTAIVQVDGGKIMGLESELLGQRIFRGIPFAAPPEGDLRWRPPQPRKSWAPDVWDATEFGNDCAQLGPCWESLGDVSNSTEDCLYLNVYTPLPPKGGGAAAPLPVMLFIPAGGFKWGAGKDKEMDSLPRTEAGRNVVLVTLNYRLGVFGFLASDELRKRDPHGSAGHYGIQDQRAAMAWVQANIAAFGGDPARVMIWGESAGASCATLHLVQPRSFGHFKRAAIESGAFNQWSTKTWQSAVDTHDALAENIGCKDRRGGTSGAAVLACLLRAPMKGLLVASDHDYGNATLPWADTMDRCQWAPPIDGVELTAPPTQLLSEGKIAPGVEVLMGSNRDEGTYFQTLPGRANDFILDTWVRFTFGSDWVEPLTKQYSPAQYANITGSFSQWYWAASRMVGDYIMTCPARRAARLFDGLASNGSANASRSYVYYFDHTPKFSINYPGNTAYMGAFHGAEIPFVFYDTFELLGSGEENMSRTMVQYWTNFAATGDPNQGPSQGVAGTPAWRPYSNASNDFMHFTTSAPKAVGAEAGVGLKNSFCDLWDAFEKAGGRPQIRYPNQVEFLDDMDGSGYPPYPHEAQVGHGKGETRLQDMSDGEERALLYKIFRDMESRAWKGIRDKTSGGGDEGAPRAGGLLDSLSKRMHALSHDMFWGLRSKEEKHTAA